MHKHYLWLALAALSCAGAVPAQTIPGLGGTQGGLSGVAGSLAGGLLPNVGTSSIGNLTGVLGYCLKNKFLGAGGASNVLNSLSGRSGVATSKDYALGQTGLLQTGNAALPLGSVKDTLRTKICDLVLKQATKLL